MPIPDNPTTRPCQRCIAGKVTGPAGIRRNCETCKGTGRI